MAIHKCISPNCLKLLFYSKLYTKCICIIVLYYTSLFEYFYNIIYLLNVYNKILKHLE